MKKNYVSPVLEQIGFEISEIITQSSVLGVEDEFGMKISKNTEI